MITMGKNTKDLKDTKTIDKKTIYKRVLKIGLGFLTLIVLFIGFLLIYLHNSSFTVAFNQIEFGGYFNDKELGKIIEIKENNVSIEIPIDVITTSFNHKIDEMKIQNGYIINNGFIDTNESKAYINTTIHGVNIPISTDVTLEINDREIQINFTNMKLRNKNFLSLPKSIEESIKDKLIKNKEILNISLDDYNIPDIATIHSINMESDKVVIGLVINEARTKQILVDIAKFKSEELYGIYKNNGDNTLEKVLDIIDKEIISNKDIEMILTDILIGNEKLIKNILILTDESKIDYVLNDYGKYITHYSKKDITNEKNKLILGKIKNYCTLLLEQVEELPQKKYVVYLNNPYDIDRDVSVFIKDIIVKYNLDIPEDVYDKMNFLYNYIDKNYMIAYKIDNKKYAVVDKMNYDFIDKKDYLAYQFEKPLETKVFYDEDIEKSIKEYFASEVFIRYMNTDGRYAFAIASDSNNYQSYERFALEKNDTWKIIDTGIDDLYTFSINHPGFNIRAITDDFIEDNIYSLSEKDINAVLDQLEYRDIIPDRKEIGIKYCSYDGKYISIKLTNDEEYVFSIKYSYLDKVYKKEVAINKWRNISPLILLQDKNNDKNDAKTNQ
ncbi:hypothetical protein [Vallitalea sp.]|jgi:hypothetical protein|uniref:hypothetical protein n=1 Tax=Vallitalea sp. TaxID=1882829 RepID=UPI0025EF1628|nr:hypothetical protein [Vallitalea sp.]MCT4688039.1 hypothetical protein [Vallitalea sp.]